MAREKDSDNENNIIDMATKKPADERVSSVPASRPIVKNDEDTVIESKVDDALFELITSLSDKLKSKALNGGFDTLAVKVENIAVQQHMIHESVDEIKLGTVQLHNALYDPEEGVFAKVRDVKDEQVKVKTELSHELEDLKKWRKQIIWVSCLIMTATMSVFAKTIGTFIIAYLNLKH